MACTPERSYQIGDLAASRLDADRVAELLDHVEGCDACSDELDLASDLVHLRAEGGASERRPPLRLVSILVAAAALLIVFVIPTGEDGASKNVELANLTPLPSAGFVARAERPPEEEAGFLAAMELYAAGNFQAAADALSPLAEADPDDLLAHLYLGIALLQTGEREGALAPLRAVADGGDGLLRERALWYLANGQLALDDAAGARATLAELVALDGDYLLNARDLLERIGDRGGR